jgi:CubicO group peptidase (beta-lactamase class C family)
MSSKIENQTYQKIEQKLQKIVRKSAYLRNALLLVHSEKRKIHWKFAFGSSGPNQDPLNADHPYHIASIGKTFTSLIIARLYERGRIGYDDPISRFLPSGMLKGLFHHRGTDHSRDVLVRHLLNHTSGIADYYEDKPVRGKPVKQMVVEEPERFWKPEDTIAYTRENQKAVSVPGKKFHYSDTGYNLLGKIIENVTDRPFHENLHNEIFDPLGMVNTYLLFYSEPRKKSPFPIADTFIGEHEVSTYKSISVDWAGGGIISTTEDLLLFQKALVTNTLIKKETFELCGRDLGKFGFGMDYGYGILFLNVGKMTLYMPGSLNMWGNFGSIAAYMFYNPVYDVYIIGSFNHSNYSRKQVIFLIDVIRKVSKLCR